MDEFFSFLEVEGRKIYEGVSRGDTREIRREFRADTEEIVGRSRGDRGEIQGCV